MNNNINEWNFKKLKDFLFTDGIRWDIGIVFLLFSNLVTVVIAVLEGWNIFIIMWLYWYQSVIIGVFNFFQIICLKSFSTKNVRAGNNIVMEAVPRTKYFIAFFFLIHYGFFHFIYFLFLEQFEFIIPQDMALSFHSQLLSFSLFIIITLAMIIVSQLIIFIRNLKTFDKDVNIGVLMFFPYARIIPLHITIILGGLIAVIASFTSASLGNVLILLIFYTLKSIADIIMHRVESKKFRSE